MIEQLAPLKKEQTPAPIDTDAYLDSLGTARTARHASEEYHSPDPGDTNHAVRIIRSDIAPSFQGSKESSVNTPSSVVALKESYWARAQRVGTEHGARAGYELEDYLTIGPGRSYADIKKRIETEYSEESVPRSLLEGVDAYHHVLQINPAHAATIMMEMIGRHLPALNQLARTLQDSGEVEALQDATTIAFERFVTNEIPAHIKGIIEKYGQGDETIRPVMNKASFYPATDEQTSSEATTLLLHEKDAAGMVEVYDIQSRPFDDELLVMGNEIAHIPAMQIAMIRVQESLVDTSRRYLDAHPERASGNLENFSEIFVPEYTDGKRELIPNPKLLRAMVNNVMPGVARSILRRNGSIDTLNAGDIIEGVRAASKEFKLFQSRIGQFDNYDEATETVELQSTFQVVCPANALFPNYLTAHLAQYYEEAVVATTDQEDPAS